MILGGGPNRIGQGIEFDYCCVHAAFALRELGFETIMVNSNPETVSTDYDTSDKLYFEPLTLEDVLNIYDQEQPEGVIVQFGGQTPLNLADGLKAAGVPIIGTQPESIEMAEDRKLFAAMLDKLGLRQTPSGSAVSAEEAIAIAREDRLSGAGAAVVCARRPRDGARLQREDLRRYMQNAIEVSPDRPVLVDRFLEDAIEVDVDCIADGEISVIGAIMEHIEQAGIHSGDSACVIPDLLAFGSGPEGDRDRHQGDGARIERARTDERAVRGERRRRLCARSESARLADRAVCEQGDRRAAGRNSPPRSWPGKTLPRLGFTKEIVPKHFSVKEAVFPFLRYQGIDIALGPGNEIDRRSHGNRCRSRPGLREIADGRAAGRCPGAETFSSA